MAAAQGCDAVYILLYSLFGIRDGNLSALDTIAAMQTMQPAYYGVVATNERPLRRQSRMTSHPTCWLAIVKNGVVTFAYPQDARRNLFVQRKR